MIRGIATIQFIKQDQVQEKIITIRNQRVIVDADVAVLYGVETKRVNEAVKNNPDKFPEGYLFEQLKYQNSAKIHDLTNPTRNFV